MCFCSALADVLTTERVPAERVLIDGHILRSQEIGNEALITELLRAMGELRGVQCAAAVLEQAIAGAVKQRSPSALGELM